MIAVLIVTHNQGAEALLRATEMIIGEQENVAFLSFLHGENGDILAEKMKSAIAGLNTEKGLIIAVDFWGGTPFNAGSRVIQELNIPCNLITGINLPMLTELLMSREDDHSVEALAELALNSAREGIRALKALSSAPEALPASEQSEVVSADIEQLRAEESRAVKDVPHLSLNLLRIDDRLIHGQVATRWTKETGINRIIVVNDAIAEDQMRTTMLKQAVPSGVSAHTVSIDKMIRVFNNPEYQNDKVMLLFTNARDVYRLFERGMPIKSVNIGGMAFKEGRIMLDMSVSVNADDVAALEALNQAGVELEIRKVPTDSKVNMMDLLKTKYYPTIKQ